eukprot:8216885-Pyramimonas_sp.AAC.1
MDSRGLLLSLFLQKSVPPQRSHSSGAFAVRAMGADDIEKKRKEAQEKMKNLMRSTQTPLSEVAKPTTKNAFEEYR